MESINTFELENFRADIIYDTCAENPREFCEHITTMVCFHRGYKLGDKHNFTVESFQEFLKENKEKIVAKYLYLYDHSGLTISTSPFSCPWDSGVVGVVYIEKEQLKKEYGKKVFTKKLQEIANNIIDSEVEEYDNYLTGQVFGIIITNMDTGEETESTWGFYGYDYAKTEAKAMLKAEVEYYKKQQIAERLDDINRHVSRLRMYIKKHVPIDKREAYPVKM